MSKYPASRKRPIMLAGPQLIIDAALAVAHRAGLRNGVGPSVRRGHVQRGEPGCGKTRLNQLVEAGSYKEYISQNPQGFEKYKNYFPATGVVRSPAQFWVNLYRSA